MKLTTPDGHRGGAPAGLAEATGVVPAGPGRWRAVIPPGWDIVGNVNGGVLLAVAGRALCAATGRPDPVTVTGHYLSPAGPGPIDIAGEIIKQGRRFTTARATLVGSDRPVLTVLGTFGELTGRAEVVLADGGPPTLPPPDQCVRVEATEGFPPPFAAHVDTRVHPDDATFLEGRPSGRAGIRAWLRLPGDEVIDTLGLLCLVDAMPPTIFNADFPIRWSPTIELTAHVRGRPAPGWVRGAATTRFISGGFLEIDVEIWDSTDRLVAQARQLALVPASEPAPTGEDPSGPPEVAR
jgi:acyl-coenzyme A thioesterase PaaI-like protein